MTTTSEALAIALAHHQAGRLAQAESIYRQVLQREPDQPDALHLLGMVVHRLGRPAEAAEHIARAIALRPGTATYHGNLGLVYRAQGRIEEAVACYERALAVKPDFAEAHNNLANARRDLGQTGEAESSYRRAVRLRPDFSEAHRNLGDLFNQQGRLAEAARCYRRALRRDRGNTETLNSLGNVLRGLGQYPKAVACYRRILKLDPDSHKAEHNLGNVLKEQGRLDEATACYRRALGRAPGSAETLSNLGLVLQLQARLDEAIDCYRQALQANPDLAEARSNALFAMQYRPGVTPAELAEAHAEYEFRHASRHRASWRAHENRRDPDRRLRLGFVSMDFACHPVGYFSIRALESLDRAHCEVVCYSHRALADDLTIRFRRTADLWRDTCGLSDDGLAEQIREDRIDILFDLAGHTAGNRLLVFARKPAPIQITWIGYVGTTGLKAMDYLLADRYQVAEGTEVHYGEKVLRLPDGYVCYDPTGISAAVGPLPAAERGHVTFGCFNNPSKITESVIAVWSRILRRVPGSRLVLQGPGLDDPRPAARFQRLFQDQGVGPERVDLFGPSPHREFLARYRDVDVALDPFPYSGGLTTCEALWMGVPVVTCPGATFASRHAYGHLSNVGFRSTIAGTLDGYVDLAEQLAADLTRLAAIRASLRAQVAASPLCDAERFAANLMDLLRQVWREWAAEFRR